MRSVLHVDMNAFYASCEQSIEPKYRARPLAVVGNPEMRHGVVLTASYDARKFGVKTGMPLWQARKLCPDIIFTPPNYELYIHMSHKIMEILTDYSPLVEQFSIDEAWIDITGTEHLWGTPSQAAENIQKKIDKSLNLPCSIGLSDNKLLAKMASEIKKPNGITELRTDDIETRLWPLPVEDLIGVGRNIKESLNKFGVYTIGDLARTPYKFLTNMFGKNGHYLYMFAHGIDKTPVRPNYENTKSFGNSITLPYDYKDRDEIKNVILFLTEEVCSRMREKGFRARRVSLTLKDHMFASQTHSMTLQDYCFSTEEIYRAVMTLFDRFWVGQHIRLVGVSVSKLDIYDYATQLCFLDNVDRVKKENVNIAIDKIRNKFGMDAIKRASLLDVDFKYSPLTGMKNFNPR
ncbi:MAG: DNA polymerase IV [Thermoanaerobacteraceae bacterium]|nr:DNA polymerase IV [Thermoanaerobacteraceae bacterium]